MNLDGLRHALSSLVTDLRKRRLLPVVGLLIIALIAIPIVLAKSGTATDVPSAGVLPAVTTPTLSAGSSKHREPSNNFRTGPAHNPFLTKTSTTVTTGASTSSTTTPTGGSTTTTGGSGSTTTPVRTVTVTVPTRSSTTTSTPPTTTPKPVYTAYQADVEFGEAGRPLKSYPRIQRYQALPSARNPIVAYLGVEHDRKTAVFVIAADATPAGSGECSPSASKCTYLALEPGNEVLLLVQTSSGASSEYQLKYVGVRKATSAKEVRDVISPNGKRLIDWAAKFMNPLKQMTYDASTGLIDIRLGRLARARAHGPR